MLKNNEKKNIPNEWSKVRLGDLGIIGDGNHSSLYPRASEMIDSGVPFIRATNVVDGKVVDNGLKYISSQKHTELKKGHLKTNDIIIVNRGQIGTVGLVTEEFNNSNLNSQLAWFRTNDLDYKYVYYYLNTNRAKSFFDSNQSGGALQQLPIKTLKDLPVFLPSQPVRLSIVRVLETWDSTIEKLDRVIELKKDVKKGLMQKLLTGELRLPGFKGEWTRTKLENISTVIAGGTPSTKESSYWTGGNIPWMKSGEINKVLVNSTDNYITSLGLKESSAKLLPVNSVLIALAGQGTTRGKVAINKIELSTNQSVAAFIPKENLNYYFLFLSLSRRYDELRSLSAGDGGRGGLNLSLLKNLEILLPQIQEQNDISDTLEAFSKEIRLLEIKREKIQNQKKYLLNNLVTGQIRTPENL